MRTTLAIVIILAAAFATVGCGNADDKPADVKTSKSGVVEDAKHGATGKAVEPAPVSTE